MLRDPYNTKPPPTYVAADLGLEIVPHPLALGARDAFRGLALDLLEQVGLHERVDHRVEPRLELGVAPVPLEHGLREVERGTARGVERARVDGRLLDQELRDVHVAGRGGEVEAVAAKERLGLARVNTLGDHRLERGEVAERRGDVERRHPQARRRRRERSDLGGEERVRKHLLARLGPRRRVRLETPA